MDSAVKKKIVPAQPGFWSDPRFSGIGALIALAIIVVMAMAVTSFIPAGSGSSDKCWNYGGRSDDTYNC